jgi:hypothetical protein
VTRVLVGGRVYFLAFSLAGPDSTPYREVDQHADVVDLEHPRRDSNPQGPGVVPVSTTGRVRLRRQGSNLRPRG